jgi:hypothetical protein
LKGILRPWPLPLSLFASQLPWSCLLCHVILTQVQNNKAKGPWLETENLSPNKLFLLRNGLSQVSSHSNRKLTNKGMAMQQTFRALYIPCIYY